MASSSPPPLIPINGSNNVCYIRETNNSAASKPINRVELQFGEFFNGASHECFKTTNASSNGEYHQQQSNYHFKHPNQFTTHSQMEINKSEFFQSTRPNPPENQLFPVADIPADLLFQHVDLLKQERTWSHQEIISDVDCYWYRKNLENVNTINCLRKEITDLRTKLIAAENHRGNIGVNKTLDWKEKTDKNNVFTCGTCRKEYKTERGLEVHQNSRHADPGCWINYQFGKGPTRGHRKRNSKKSLQQL
ncbi:uncharacterized protein LOC124338186 isoform X3 [Daphnia pulicaria]|uniref:uncharacterized protein LOC124338186 isoform X3 n=1 Tax=Daphnia pulicaria TaxID=35523 RepID=UPI001EE9F07D|nr:uncharacterized protein LOC124338186 isoform X3 [Daphnia pulicaria]